MAKSSVRAIPSLLGVVKIVAREEDRLPLFVFLELLNPGGMGDIGCVRLDPNAAVQVVAGKYYAFYTSFF